MYKTRLTHTTFPLTLTKSKLIAYYSVKAHAVMMNGAPAMYMSRSEIEDFNSVETNHN